MGALKHFVNECVGSIQLEVSRHFGVLGHFGWKIIYENPKEFWIILILHAHFLTKMSRYPQLYSTPLKEGMDP